MKIEQATLNDWDAIRAIYIEGIQTKNATFETVENVTMDGAAWFAKKIPGLIFKAVGEDGCLIGWAALSPVSSRCVYAGVAEVSVYVSGAVSGSGVGTALLKRLVDASERANIWTLQASIFPENVASIRLHEKAGFRTVGIREKIAQMDGKWRNTQFMERRSPLI